MRAYFNKFKYQSITTDDFKDYLLSYFSGEENLKSIDWNFWLYSTGLPPIIPQLNLFYLILNRIFCFVNVDITY